MHPNNSGFHEKLEATTEDSMKKGGGLVYNSGFHE
jgi:hypothetical protein